MFDALISFCHSLLSANRMVFLCVIIAITATGCASAPPQSELDTTHFKERVNTREKGGLRVSTSVLSADESRAVYGVRLAKKGIQPVWIEVENRDDVAYWLMYSGVDPNFFPASEAADAFDSEEGRKEESELDQRFAELAFRNPVPARGKVSGFVLTTLDEGVKMVEVDLVASGALKAFSFINVVPGFRADYKSRETFVREIHDPDEITDFTDDAALRAALERLPCCVTNKKGTRNGDPLNLVVVGGLENAFPAFVRRGWHPTEEIWAGSVAKMGTSAIVGDRYPNAPISSLYLYGRPQDIALQKARDNIHQRNHLRLWLSPIRYRGKQVWVGQISRDIGSRMTIHSPTLTTHKIDPDVDEARTALMEDMAYSQRLAKLGMVKGVGAASRDAPRDNLTRDPYYTDGFRAVLIFESRPHTLEQIDFLPWEGREGGFIEHTTGENQP